MGIEFTEYCLRTVCLPVLVGIRGRLYASVPWRSYRRADVAYRCHCCSLYVVALNGLSPYMRIVRDLSLGLPLSWFWRYPIEFAAASTVRLQPVCWWWVGMAI